MPKATAKKQPEKKLTEKQIRFIDWWLICFNATKAAKEAGYSEQTAYSIGHENLRKPEIIAEIKRRQAESKKRLPENLVSHLENLAFFNIADFLDDDGEIDLVKVKENLVPGIVNGVNINEMQTKNGRSRNVSLKMLSADKAIDLLGKYLKVYGPEGSVQTTINNNVNVSEEVVDALSKLKKHKKAKK